MHAEGVLILHLKCLSHVWCKAACYCGSKLALHAYTDSDWGSNKHTRYVGLYELMAGGPLGGCSNIVYHHFLCYSRCRMMGLSAAAWYGSDSTTPPKIGIGNMSARQLVINRVYLQRLKHIDTKFYLLRAQVVEKSVHQIHVSNDDQSADFLTKMVPRHMSNKIMCSWMHVIGFAVKIRLVWLDRLYSLVTHL